MKHILIIAAMVATSFAVHAELPASGFRAVKGGASPDGRWVVCVLDSVTAKGEIVVVYYGFHPKDEAFRETEEGKTFDRNRIQVVYGKDGGDWKIRSVASPGNHGEPRSE